LSLFFSEGKQSASFIASSHVEATLRGELVPARRAFFWRRDFCRFVFVSAGARVGMRKGFGWVEQGWNTGGDWWRPRGNHVKFQVTSPATPTGKGIGEIHQGHTLLSFRLAWLFGLLNTIH
jgi:hypothetical protein